MHTYKVSSSNEWRKYFPTHNLDKDANLVLTEQGEYSITKPMEGKQIIDIMTKYIPLRATILDGTGGCGGDTISFAMTFDHVISVEIDASNCQCLKNNLSAYTLNDKVTLACPNSLVDIIDDPKYKFDAVFIDPPWGGVDYRSHASLNLYLCKALKAPHEITKGTDDKCLGRIIISSVIERIADKIFMMKVPNNFNFKEFKLQVPDRKVHVYPITKYYYELKDNDVNPIKTKYTSFHIIVCEPATSHTMPKGGYHRKYRKYKNKYLSLKKREFN